MENINFFEYSDSRRRTVRMAYRDNAATGKPLLLLHGFAASSSVWSDFIAALPQEYRILALDLKGHGMSLGAPEEDEDFSPPAQAEAIREFIRAKRLDNLDIIGHSLGATAAAIAAADPFVAGRIDRLMLIAPGGTEAALPEKIAALSSRLPSHNPLLRAVGGELKAYWLLNLFTASPDEISDAMIERMACDLSRPGAIDAIGKCARQMFIPDQLDFAEKLRRIKVKTMLVWGKNDRIYPVENSAVFRKEIADCTMRTLPDCGHLPHMEKPTQLAALFSDFRSKIEIPLQEEESESRDSYDSTRVRLHRLFDYWHPGSLGFLLFLKFLQLLRKCGIRANENGWRKATGIFMRNEYSKFILSCFRLNYYRSALPPANFEQAKEELIDRLRIFLESQSSFHWTAEPGFLFLGRRKTFFCDIVVATYNADGSLAAVEPHFAEPDSMAFAPLTPEQIELTLNELVTAYNKFSRISGRNRAAAMQRHLRRWSRGAVGYKFAPRSALRLLIDRLMTATYLHCEILPREDETAQRLRLRTPQLKRYRHPGWGLLNIFCRFTPDFEEADLWVQFHHVPVDGAPMQELLDKLKNEWGSNGRITFPAVNSPAARPEIFHCGDRLFRAKFYLNFHKLLTLRKHLNASYCRECDGAITIAGMILWGLSRHPYFFRRKMLFPVDTSDGADSSGRERELSLVFIRPYLYNTPDAPLKGFLKFQKAFNKMIDRTRRHCSESDEFLELCSMAPPLLYHMTNWFMPNTLREIVGTVGVSIIRDAEMFISPLSDFQTAGFMAIGSMNMPSADGGSAGAVTVCATRKQVRYYIAAMNTMAEEYCKYLDIPEKSVEDASR